MARELRFHLPLGPFRERTWSWSRSVGAAQGAWHCGWQRHCSPAEPFPLAFLPWAVLWRGYLDGPAAFLALASAQHVSLLVRWFDLPFFVWWYHSWVFFPWWMSVTFVCDLDVPFGFQGKLPLLLSRMNEVGKVFLVTNSDYKYTDVSAAWIVGLVHHGISITQPVIGMGFDGTSSGGESCVF